MSLTRRTRHTVLTGVLLSAVLALSPAAARPAHAASADDGDPAVIEVQRALDAAETAAASASRRALDASAAAERARVQAEATAERAATLTAQSLTADAELAEASARAGASASRLYRTTVGGPLVAQLLTTADPDSLLQRLGILDRVTTVAARTAGRARSAADVAESLRSQADGARAEASRLADEAESTAAAARAQADTEATTVAATQAELDGLYARLAALRETTAAQERAARLAQQTAAQAAEPGGATGGGAGAGGGASGAGAGSGTSGSGSSGSSGGSGSGGSSGGGTGSSGGSGGGSSSGGSTAPAGPTMSPGEARDHARGAIRGYGWGDDQFSCLVSLWNRESGWRAEALNPWSGAYGIPQALPGEKMSSAGPDWRTNAATQIAWGLSYIKARYGSPCGAWAHSESTGWY